MTRHDKGRQYENCDFCSDWCLTHNTLNNAVVLHWIGELKLDFDQHDKKEGQEKIPAIRNIE